MGILLYRLIESIDGERKYHIISYQIGQKIKNLILTYLI